MNKFRNLVLVFGILSTLSSYAQEEFFINNTGLSVSGSSDFSALSSGGLSLHLKNGLIFSGSILLPIEGSNIPAITTIGYLLDLNKKSEKNKLNAIISLSNISYNLGSVGYISPTLGILYTSFQNDNCPTTFGLSTSAYFYKFNFDYIEQSNLTFYFAQAFFAQKRVYPVVGLTYSIPLKQTFGYGSGDGSFLFHVGLNIRLSKPNSEKSKE